MGDQRPGGHRESRMTSGAPCAPAEHGGGADGGVVKGVEAGGLGGSGQVRGARFPAEVPERLE